MNKLSHLSLKSVIQCNRGLLSLLKCSSRNLYSSLEQHSGFEKEEFHLEKVREFCRTFIAPVENETLMRNLMKSFVDQLDIASLSDKKHLSGLITKNTFTQDFATGTEKGQFLSLLIGEHQLEIMMITIYNELTKKSDKKVLKLKNFQKREYTTEMLMALVAEFVIDYVRDDIPYAELSGRIPSVVITYEMPHWLDQTSLNNGVIIKSSIGEVLSKNQQREIHEILTFMLQCWGHNLEIKCVMSFGTACFHDKQWSLKECIASIVLDHGITICHLEDTQNVKGFDESKIDKSKPKILMMTDMAEFGRNKELASITTYSDKALDLKSSSKPGKKRFRKFISETYIGEIFRLMVVKLIKDGLLLQSELTYQIRRPFCLSSEDVAYFENWMNNEKSCQRVLKFKLGYDNYSMIDLLTLNYLADVLVDRTTRLTALVLAALAERSKENDIGFVFLGGLVSHQRIFRNRLSDYVRTYTKHLGKNVRVVKASADSALRGAALFASRL